MFRKNTMLGLGGLLLLALTAPATLIARTVFKTAVSYDTGGYWADSMAVADVNGDGKLDVVVANKCAAYNCGSGGTGLGIVVLLGNGDGTFQSPIDVGDRASVIAVADVSQDGKPDLIEIQGTTVVVRLGNGDGTFQPGQGFASGGGLPVAIAVADVNGNGKPDLLVASACPPDTCGLNGVVGVLLGRGDGTFKTVTTYDAGGRFTDALAIGDVNRDGKPDLLLANQESASVGVLLGNGDGTFQSAQTYPTSDLPFSIATADLKGDGKMDLLVAGSGLSILFGNGDGTFQAPQFYGDGDEVIVGDVNRDGRPDMLAAKQCVVASGSCSRGIVRVFLNNGDGTFLAPETYNSGGNFTYSMALADVDRDTKVDLLTVNLYFKYLKGTTGSVGVLLNKYQASTTTTLTSSPNPSVFGEPVTLTANVVSVGLDVPTGRVNFKDGGKIVGSAILSGGVAVLTTTKLPVGTLSLIAAYKGDTYSAKSTSAVHIHVVNP